MTRAAFLQGLRTRLRLLFLLAMVGVLMPLPSRLATDHPTLGWALDLASHWQWLAVPVALLCAVFAWQGLARLAALVVLGLGLLGLGWVMPHQAPAAEGPGPQPLRLVTANVHVGATEPAALLAWAREHDAALILLQEVSPAYAEALARASTDYGHQVLEPRDDPFGLAILSRHPLESTTLVPGPGGIPSLQATVRLPGGPVPIVVAHPFPPLSAAAHQDRAAFVAGLEARAAELPTLVVGGDFNASPWSSAFAGVHHLTLASRGLPTWYGVLPIDHVLVGPAWARVRAERGPAGTSDHRPLFVELRRRP